VQYTRNMVTGASTSDVAVILVDARHGLREQSHRHAALSALLGIDHLILAVNKMDLVGWSRDRYEEIRTEFDVLASKLGVTTVTSIPLCALDGGNVVDPSPHTPWYHGPTLLEHLETVEIAGDRDLDHRRFPVQWVIRPISDEHHDYRGYAGQVAGGVWQAGDDVVVLPSGRRSSVASVETADGPLDVAVPGMSVTVRLADDVDVSRGDMLADPEQAPTVARELEATVCWMAETPLEPRAKLAIKHTTRTVRAIVDELVSVVDIHTLEDLPGPERLELNDIAKVRLRLSEPLAVDAYADNRATGAFILIDEATNDTVAAGMILAAS